MAPCTACAMWNDRRAMETVPVHQLDLGSLLQGAAGRPVAIGCSRSRILVGCEAPAGFRLPMDEAVHQVRIWDFETRRPLGPWIADDDGFEQAMIGELAGRPALACGGRGGEVRIWDPATGRLIHSLDVGGGWIQTLALCEHDGQPILVASTGDHIVQAWDPRSAEALSPPFGKWRGHVYAVAAGHLQGDPVMAATDDEGSYLWNLAKREPIRKLPPCTGTGYALALGHLADQPVLVSVNEERGRRQAYHDRWGNATTAYSVVTLWNLSEDPASGSQLPYPITRPKGVTIGEISGRPAIVSIYDEGLPLTDDSFLFVWYPTR